MSLMSSTKSSKRDREWHETSVILSGILLSMFLSSLSHVTTQSVGMNVAVLSPFLWLSCVSPSLMVSVF